MICLVGHVPTNREGAFPGPVMMMGPHALVGFMISIGTKDEARLSLQLGAISPLHCGICAGTQS
jgi:hypothetical protein